MPWIRPLGLPVEPEVYCQASERSEAGSRQHVQSNQTLPQIAEKITNHVEEIVLGGNRHGIAVRTLVLDDLVPPDIARLVHGGPKHVGPPEDHTLLHTWAFVQSHVDNFFELDRFTPAAVFVASKDDFGARVVDAVTDGVGRETGKDDAVHDPETGAG